MNEEKKKFFLQPGYIFVSEEPYLLSTVLGSCVSVCIWDPIMGFGGMNHHIHAKPFNKKDRSSQFGSIAIPHMIKLLIKMGAVKSHLKAHVVGGAQSRVMSSSTIGKENIKIAVDLLKKNNIEIVTFDTEGEMGRKLIFDNQTGEIVVYKVNNLRGSDWHGN